MKDQFCLSLTNDTEKRKVWDWLVSKKYERMYERYSELLGSKRNGEGCLYSQWIPTTEEKGIMLNST